jgi:streptogramin lyase
MAGFATDATHVSSSGTALAKVGIANAFANVANLETLGTGVALATTPGGNGTAPQTTTNTLANILAACINSTGSGSTACTTLLGDALSGGTTGTAPLDTATAAINMAHNPVANIPALYGLSTATPPFAPALTGAPNDFTLGIKFTGGGLSTPSSIAIDATGDAWIANYVGNSVTRLTNTGSVDATYTGGGLLEPSGVAIDGSGSAWLADDPNATGLVTKITASGTYPAGSSGYTSGGISYPFGIAIDGSSDVWITDESAATKLATSNGAVLSGSGGYTAGGILSSPTAIAIDGGGNAWMTNSGSSMVKLSSSGTLDAQPTLPPSTVWGVAADASGSIWVADGTSLVKLSNTGATLGTYTGGGIVAAASVAIDGAGNAWVANFSPSTTSPTHVSVVELSNSGTVLSGASGFGYSSGTSLAAFFSNLLAVDGSGDVWLAGNGSTNSVTELIGAAAPVITPIAAGLPATPTGNGSSSLGTRP